MAWLVLLFVAVVLLCVAGRYFSWPHLRGIPSPPSLPLLGHLLDIQAKTLHGFTFQSFRKYGPIFTLWWGSRPFVVVCNHELARKVMMRISFRCMLPAPFVGDDLSFYNLGLLFSNNALHRTLRTAWAPHFLPGSLANYHQPMVAATQRLLGWLSKEAKAGVPFDVHRYCGCMTMEVVGRAAFGIDIDGYQMDSGTAATTAANAAAGAGASQSETGGKILAAFRNVFRMAQPRHASAWVALFVMLPEAWADAIGWMAKALPDAPWRTLTQAHAVLRRTSLQLIQSNKGVEAATSKKTFIEHIMSARIKETGAPLPETSVMSNITTFLGAGYETSANTLAFAVFHLAQHPEAQAAVLQEIDSFGPGYAPTLDDLDKLPYITAVIDETMRLTPVASFLFRRAPEPITIGDYTLPAGTDFQISIWSVHRDPDVWKDADAFVPERFLPGGDPVWAAPEGAFMPFGGGQRMCIGYKFAYQELKLALFSMYQRFTFRLSPADAQLHLSTGITTGPDNGIWVTAHEREEHPVVHACA